MGEGTCYEKICILYDVVVLVVGELVIFVIYIQVVQVYFIWLVVFEFDEFVQVCQEFRVFVGVVFIGQDGEFIGVLWGRGGVWWYLFLGCYFLVIFCFFLGIVF